MHIFFVLFTILANFCRADDEIRWDALRVTWGRGLMPNEFDKMPLTVQEARSAGFTKLPGECKERKFAGHRYMKGSDTGIILLYDMNGYIAGVQTAIPVDDVNKVNTDYPYLTTPAFQQDSIVAIDVLVLTTYIVNPSKICNGGRTQEEFEWDVAEGLWIQNGSDPIDDSFMVPTIEDDIGSTKWSKGGCFPTMGNHYWYNIRGNMDCKEHFPFFLMYNKKKLTGYGFANIGKFTFTQRYEYPSSQAIEVFLAQRVPCYNEEFERARGFSTFHIYLVDNPAILAC